MTTWYESAVDRQIRQAQESGQFDDLPGLGKPLPGHNQDYDEDWWLKDLVRREDITGVLPESLAVRREAEDLIERISKKSSEHAVRRTVDELTRGSFERDADRPPDPRWCSGPSTSTRQSGPGAGFGHQVPIADRHCDRQVFTDTVTVPTTMRWSEQGRPPHAVEIDSESPV